MTTVAILGTGPLPIERDSYSYGSSNRTWHIAKGLLDRGHRVHVIAFRPMRTENGKLIPDEEHRRFQEGEFSLDSVDTVKHFYDDRFLLERVESIGAEAIVGVNLFPASRACHLHTSLPIWADLNGFNMGEVQIRAASTGNEEAIRQGWNDELPTLCRADVFSAASLPQRYAVIGELAGIGRLSGATCGYEFVHVIPNGREDFPPLDGTAHIRTQLGSEAVLGLWVGAYNYQFDIETLFEGFELAMAKNPHLHFVSTGGRVDGHNETTYADFRARIDKSPHRDRYHFVGWLPQEDFERLMRSCDFGVSTDLDCYETEIGARNRLTEMTRAGLPAVTTLGPEIAHHIHDREAGWTVPFSDPGALAEALLTAAADRQERTRRGGKARALFEECFTIEASLAPLFPWAENPYRAPDHGRWPLLVAPPARPENPARGWGERIRARLFGKA
jgi:glycosyltransferase involved in cell wall biosynthesis